jgi:hypothetical protein
MSPGRVSSLLVGRVIGPVISIRRIIRISGINRGIIAVGWRWIVAIGGRIVRIRNRIPMAPIASSPADILNESRLSLCSGSTGERLRGCCGRHWAHGHSGRKHASDEHHGTHT